MQELLSLLKAVRLGSVEPKEDHIKFHSDGLSGADCLLLGQAYKHPLVQSLYCKRSGTGITVIVKLKKS